MTVKHIIQGRSLAKNTGLNLLGYVIPMLFLVFATPIITSGLGIDRYGVLSLVWLIIGYFVIFDLGLGAATTRFVAAAIGDSHIEEIPKLVWTTTLVQLIAGLLAGTILAGLTPFLVERVFEIPEELITEGKHALWIASFTFPLTFVSGSLNGLFAAFQRFDLVNYVKVINSVSIYIAGLLCVYVGGDVPFIVTIVLLARVFVLFFQFLKAKQTISSFFTIEISQELFRRVAAFAGWITVSNIINPLMFYLDRFLIAAILSMSALTYYSVPFDLAARVWIISISLTMALFPAFATLIAQGERDKSYEYFLKSIKFLVVASGPVVCLMLVFSGYILDIWVGAQFAAQSTLVLQLLLVSTLIDYPGIIASTLLEGAGKPRLIAMVKMAYLPIHAMLIYGALTLFGLAGAALAIFVMRLIYSTVFSWAALRLLSMRANVFFKGIWPCYLIIVIFLAVAFFVGHWTISLGWPYMLISMLVLVGIYGIAAWYWILDSTERMFIIHSVNSLLGRYAHGKLKVGS